jgi:ATP-binding cassette, subfamily B (MDR/TAP), member 1
MIYQLAVGEKIMTLITIVAMLVTGIGLALYAGWMLTLVIMAYLPFLIIAYTKNFSAKVKIAKEEGAIFQEIDSHAQEVFSSIKLVKQMNAEAYEISTQQGLLDKIKENYKSLAVQFIIWSSLAVVSFDLGMAVGYWYGSECIFGSSLCPGDLAIRPYTVGTIVKVFCALFLPAVSLNQLSPSLEKIAEGKAAAARIFKVIDRVPLIKSKPGAIRPSEFKGVVEFVDVDFAYPKDRSRLVFEGMNVRIECLHTALMGESGGGKSTVFQLLMRFYDPDRGAVLLDGVDLRDLDLEWLRDQIGYVTQEPVLFATSIRENMLLGKADASDEEIQKVLQIAEAF